MEKLRNLHTWNLHKLKISNIDSGNVLWVVRAKNTEEFLSVVQCV